MQNKNRGNSATFILVLIIVVAKDLNKVDKHVDEVKVKLQSTIDCQTVNFILITILKINVLHVLRIPCS